MYLYHPNAWVQPTIPFWGWTLVPSLEQSCQSVVIKTHQDISTKGSMFLSARARTCIVVNLLADALYFRMVCIQYGLRRNKLWHSIISSEKLVGIQASSLEHSAFE